MYSLPSWDPGTDVGMRLLRSGKYTGDLQQDKSKVITRKQMQY